MFKETARTAFHDSDSLILRNFSEEPIPVSMKGYHKDTVRYKDGRVEVFEGHNLVVTSFLNVVASFLKNKYPWAMYWAVGSGSSSWDSMATLPTPLLADTALVNEIGRMAVSDSEIVFLNGSYEESATPTNIIQITHLFGEGDCNGEWREFGLFSGNATAASGSGIMINERRHRIITKTSDMTIERVMRFTLELS